MQKLFQVQKLSDRQIFDFLINSGYCVQLQHIELRAKSGYDGLFPKDYKQSQYKVKPLNLFGENCEGYVKNDNNNNNDNSSPPSSNNYITIQIIPNNKEITYHATGYERVLKFNETQYIEHCGNNKQYQVNIVIILLQ